MVGTRRVVGTAALLAALFLVIFLDPAPLRAQGNTSSVRGTVVDEQRTPSR